MLVLVLGLIIIIQFIPRHYNISNTIDRKDISEVFETPSEVNAILRNSCYDCHSNNTRYPWYNKVQPVSWYMERHIEEGKKELNFSKFGDYSSRRQKSKLKAVINQIKDGEMPLDSYTLIHRDARLSTSEKKVLYNWMNKLIDSL